MRSTRFPREYRLYLPDEEVKDEEGNVISRGAFIGGEEITNRGFTLTADGLPYFNKAPFDCVILWWTGFHDKNRVKVYEGDICKMFLSSGFGSMVESLGIMAWDNQNHRFILHMGAQESGKIYDAVDTERIGHEITHPELLAKILEKAKIITT